MAFQIIVAGTSRAGFHALQTVLGNLPKQFTLPIVVVQHRSFDESGLLAPLLATFVQLPVVEVDDKQEIEGGRIFVAPPNYHILIDGSNLALSTEAPVLDLRPSIDVLFESAADCFGEGVLGLLLTGMSRDGIAGLKRIRERGGLTLIQNPAAAEGRIMRDAAIEAGIADRILPLENIARFLVDLSVGQRMNA